MAGKPGRGGAPKGNQNSARGRVWRDAINRVLERRSRAQRVAELELLAEKLIDKCHEGDIQALREFGDRIEGKPAQIVTGDPEGAPVQIVIGRVDADL
jgi:hypothetical protein